MPKGVGVETPEDRLEVEDLEDHAEVKEEDGESGESNVGPILPVDEAPREPEHRVEKSDADVHL